MSRPLQVTRQPSPEPRGRAGEGGGCPRGEVGAGFCQTLGSQREGAPGLSHAAFTEKFPTDPQKLALAPAGNSLPERGWRGPAGPTESGAAQPLGTRGTHQGEKKAETRDPSHTEGAWQGARMGSLAADTGVQVKGPHGRGAAGQARGSRDGTRERTVPTSIPPRPVSRCCRSVSHASQGLSELPEGQHGGCAARQHRGERPQPLHTHAGSQDRACGVSQNPENL